MLGCCLTKTCHVYAALMMGIFYLTSQQMVSQINASASKKTPMFSLNVALLCPFFW